MDIAILLYEHMTALDAIGPYETLSRMPGATVTFVADEPGPKRTDAGSLALVADAALTDLPHPEIIVIPGGPVPGLPMRHEPTLDWIRTAHETSRWTTSVCTGSLILGAAGLLDGVRATSHWRALDILAEMGAEVAHERVVFDGRIVTAAGVSAGIDMGLTLAARIAGDETAQAIQLGIEYDPQPPFDCGSPAKAPAAIVDLLMALRDEAKERDAADLPA
jgi:putative intracellular protease/amidase